MLDSLSIPDTARIKQDTMTIKMDSVVFDKEKVSMKRKYMFSDSIMSVHNLRTASNIYESYNVNSLQYTPKSPVVSSIISQVDCPVSLYNGIPEINIPIYNISIDGLNIPISLNYHASGIKVAQESSWVGLGWSLNAGGVVARSIMGGDDFYEEVPPGYIREGYLTAPEITEEVSEDYFETIYESLAFPNVYLVKDAEPDIFSYSMPGYSGKFLIDKSRGPVQVEPSVKLKIEYPTDDALKKYFVITSPDGTKYTFRKYESTSSISRSGSITRNNPNASRFDDNMDYVNRNYSSPMRYTSSWMLTDIMTTNNRHVSFDYEAESYVSPAYESAELYHVLRQMDGMVGPGNNAVVYTCHKSIISTWRLKRISWDEGHVEFLTSSRNDIVGETDGTAPEKLDAVVVKNSLGTTIKRTNFFYDYMNNNYSGNYQHVFKRLMLNSVKDSIDTNCCYDFEYYNGSLPAKNSNNIDYWGYYNGIEQGENYYCPTTYLGTMYAGADKSSSVNHMKIATLHKITNPTKGCTTLNYGAYTEITSPSINTVTHRVHEVANVYKEDMYDTYSQYPESFSETVNISVSTTMSIRGFLENEGCNLDPNVVYDHDSYAPFRIYKHKSNGTREIVFYYPVPSAMLTNCSYDYDDRNIILGPGTYTIEAESMTNDTWYCFSYTYDKTETVTSPATTRYGAGLRVESITGATTKNYTYTDGKMLVSPIITKNILITEPVLIGDNTYEKCYTQYMVQCSKPGNNLSTLGHGYIYGYSNVMESEGNKFTKHYFYNHPEVNPYPECAQVPAIYDGMNGVEWKVESNQYTEEKSYELRESQEVKGFVYESEAGHIYDYLYIVKWPLLVGKTLTESENGGTHVSATTYTYDDYFRLKTEIITDGSSTYTKAIRYPVASGNMVEQSMINKYMIGTQLENTLSKAGYMVAGKKTQYIESQGKILPSVDYKLKQNVGLTNSNYSSYYKADINYSNHNEYGMPMQMTANSENTVIIWSYKGIYPVAIIKNASYSEVAAILSSNFINSITSKQKPTSTDMNSLDQLRNLRDDWSVVTYEYLPLMGMVSETDERGLKKIYEYDSSARLSGAGFKIGNQTYYTEKYNYNYPTR